MSDMEDKGNIKISWKVCRRVAITVFAVFLCMRYWEYVETLVNLVLGGLLAVFAGLVISYVLNIPLRFFERILPGPTGDGTRNRGLSILLTLLCAVGVRLFVGILVVPNLVGAVIKLAQAAPGVVATVTDNEFLSQFIPAPLVIQIQSIDWDGVINSAASWLQSGVVSSLPQIANVFGQIGAWFMGILMSFWFLGEKDSLSAGVHTLIANYLGKHADERFSRATQVADGCFRGYFKGAALESVIFGTLVLIACTLAGMPEALMLGALVGVMSLIPMIGALIGAILGAIIILANSWQQALIFMVLFFVMQQVEANFFYPNVVGKQVGLTGMWPLIGITLGVAVLGFPGAFVGVPLTATIFRMVEADLAKRDPNGAETRGAIDRLREEMKD